MISVEELYKKINNGEIDIKYLAPTDLVKLELYLEKTSLNLNNLLIEIKKKNNELSRKNNNLIHEE